jgi:hypothetical protein
MYDTVKGSDWLGDQDAIEYMCREATETFDNVGGDDDQGVGSRVRAEPMLCSRQCLCNWCCPISPDVAAEAPMLWLASSDDARDWAA